MNVMEVVIPDFQDLFVDHALAPFFVFQMFTVLLWCLDEYWYFSVFTGVMMVGMECTTIYQRIRNMKTLRDMAEVPVRDITVIRNKKEVVVRTNELLPLDIFVVPNNMACPVDALLVKGTAVVNEASLTGESTPQLKEAPDHSDLQFSMKKHARHMLFAGTQILLSSGPQVDANAEGARKCALAVVLKTGFETKQGKLLRTILHSQGRISENSGEAFAFIGVLVVFALAASGYLLRRGLADPSRSRWRLFLSCVQIITSVVPSELPMELSLAVNTTLLSLTKLKVFCTEPFRIPFAGMVDTCCFDKTGTLTTDEMLFAGVNMVDGNGILNKMKMIPKYSEMVLATCHSLVYLDENTLAGDEMEKAATAALGYSMGESGDVIHNPPKKKEEDEKSQKTAPVVADPRRNYRIVARFPFLAALRRMSCIISSREGKYVVAKGSPEAIAALCVDMPKEAQRVAEKTASEGYRVIALAYRKLDSSEGTSKQEIATKKRQDVEKNLTFAGLAVYVCPLKKDAQETIENLQGGSHRCVIITGDSVQTAICVGRDVSMLLSARQLVAREEEKGKITWADAATGEVVASDKAQVLGGTFVRTRQVKAPKDGQWDLCVNAEVLSADAFHAIVEEYNEQVTIWARCAPTQKEDIVNDLKKKNHMVMMAGDGTNDVGALKQAHAGIAVLNSASVAPAADQKDKPVGPQTHNEPDVPADHKIPAGFQFTVVPPQPPQTAGFSMLMKWKMLEARRKTEIAQIAAWNKKLQAAEKEKADAKAIAPPKNNTLSETDFLVESLFNADDENFGGPPMIKLGDASIAAPFTCRSKALTSVCDIVRLGRTTLVTTHMMYKILALNCLVSAYSMSVLRCEGVKLGEKQMILSGMILSVCFMCMSRSKPLPNLCPQRPVTRLFHPYMITTVFLQFALHLYSMVQTAAMVAEVDREGIEEMRRAVEDETFKPTLLNSTMFLMTTLISGVTFAVNYRGEPFMESHPQEPTHVHCLDRSLHCDLLLCDRSRRGGEHPVRVR
ncbi:cation-transporting ATPase 13A1 [Strigomonas culicis]|uniref:Cation-transporting ATPase 13A1 n=1 Tax=Strigomonas culicis TaxID=28005 RepID=S9TLI7_9TRYP|nr:cation-transporting ATPase 13A1 [Strigomonas culicis]|eukprot:EPY19067.1 cation-transporting ATPase 13A1 [Strigomonas culicis]